LTSPNYSDRIAGRAAGTTTSQLCQFQSRRCLWIFCNIKMASVWYFRIRWNRMYRPVAVITVIAAKRSRPPNL